MARWRCGSWPLVHATVPSPQIRRFSGTITKAAIFLDAYNHARRLKTLRGLTPYEHVLQVWTKEPERFTLDPSHHIPGPYN